MQPGTYHQPPPQKKLHPWRWVISFILVLFIIGLSRAAVGAPNDDTTAGSPLETV